jgi:hypothetical protein
MPRIIVYAYAWLCVCICMASCMNIQGFVPLCMHIHGFMCTVYVYRHACLHFDFFHPDDGFFFSKDSWYSCFLYAYAWLRVCICMTLCMAESNSIDPLIRMMFFLNFLCIHVLFLRVAAAM